MDQIIIDISADPVNGTARKLHLQGLQIKSDLNMVLTANVVYYATDGRTMQKAIEDDPVLTRQQKAIQIQRYQTQTVIADTTNVLVDQNGDPVLSDENGNYPEGLVPELTFWQNINVAQMLVNSGLPEQILQVLQNVKFSQLFYGAIQAAMNSMDTRKRF
jgi:hypothetical protein